MYDLVSAAAGGASGVVGGVLTTVAVQRFRVGRLEADVKEIREDRARDVELMTEVRIEIGKLIERVADIKALLQRNPVGGGVA